MAWPHGGQEAVLSPGEVRPGAEGPHRAPRLEGAEPAPRRHRGRGELRSLTEVNPLRHLASGHREQDGSSAILAGLGRGGQDRSCVPWELPASGPLRAVSPQPPRPTSWYFSRATLVSAPSCVSMKSSLFLWMFSRMPWGRTPGRGVRAQASWLWPHACAPAPFSPQASVGQPHSWWEAL